MKKALIRDGIVVNIIVADDAFCESIANQYDNIICITNIHPYPGPGWLCDENDEFSEPPEA